MIDMVRLELRCSIKPTEKGVLVIDMALKSTAESTAIQAKRRAVLEYWDNKREVELGDEAGLWEVLYCSTGM